MPQFHRTAQHEFYAFFVCCKLRTHSGNLKVENRMIITKKKRFVVIVLLAGSIAGIVFIKKKVL